MGGRLIHGVDLYTAKYGIDIIYEWLRIKAIWTWSLNRTKTFLMQLYSVHFACNKRSKCKRTYVSSSSFLFNVRIFPSRMGLDGRWLLSTFVDPALHAPPLPTSSYAPLHTHYTFSEAFPLAVAPQLSSPSSHPTHPLCPLRMSKSAQSSLPQLNRKVFNSTHLCHLQLGFPSCHLTPAMYINILQL